MTFPILFFAAGRGTRMAPLTDQTPKPLIKVAGKTLLDHATDAALGDHLGPAVVNVHYKADQIRQHLTGRDIAISDETDMLRETGGGLRHALPLLQGDPVMTMNTDAVWSGPRPGPFLAKAWRDDMQSLLLLIDPARAVGHVGKGDFLMDETGRLTRGPGLIYTGLQITRTRWLSDIKEDVFSMNLGWDIAADHHALYGLVYPGLWCDVGRPDCIPLAEKLLSNHV